MAQNSPIKLNHISGDYFVCLSISIIQLRALLKKYNSKAKIPFSLPDFAIYSFDNFPQFVAAAHGKMHSDFS